MKKGLIDNYQFGIEQELDFMRVWHRPRPALADDMRAFANDILPSWLNRRRQRPDRDDDDQGRGTIPAVITDLRLRDRRGPPSTELTEEEKSEDDEPQNKPIEGTSLFAKTEMRLIELAFPIYVYYNTEQLRDVYSFSPDRTSSEVCYPILKNINNVPGTLGDYINSPGQSMEFLRYKILYRHVKIEHIFLDYNMHLVSKTGDQSNNYFNSLAPFSLSITGAQPLKYNFKVDQWSLNNYYYDGNIYYQAYQTHQHSNAKSISMPSADISTGSGESINNWNECENFNNIPLSLNIGYLEFPAFNNDEDTNIYSLGCVKVHLVCSFGTPQTSLSYT